jgi:hypothetical protein
MCSLRFCLFLTAVSAFAGISGAELLKIDMDGAGGPTATGWESVNGGNRFDKPPGNAEEPEPITIDLDGDGTDELIRAGYNGWAQGWERDRGVDPNCGWPDEWPQVLQDFSGPKASTTARFIIWNVPAGEYDVTAYMRDHAYPSTAYRVVYEGASDTLFEVLHADYVCGDFDSISDTHRVSTVIYDPDGAGTNYDAQPSLVFKAYIDPGTGSPVDTTVNGYQIQWVPEPATMGLLALGILPLLRRRRK